MAAEADAGALASNRVTLLRFWQSGAFAPGDHGAHQVLAVQAENRSCVCPRRDGFALRTPAILGGCRLLRTPPPACAKPELRPQLMLATLLLRPLARRLGRMQAAAGVQNPALDYDGSS